MKALLQTFQCHAARRVRRVGQGRRALLLFPALLLMNGCAGWQEFETGSRLAERGDLDGAVNSLNQAVNADPRNARFVMALHETRIKAAQAHLLNARAMMEQNDATAAQAEIAKAFECYPELTESVELARDAEELTRQAETTSEASSQALEQAKWDKAVRLARQALAIDRGSLAALTASHKAIQAACVFHIQCADELLEAGNWLGCLAACQILEDLDAARSEYDVVRRQALNRREAEIRCREAAELASVTGFAAALELSESAVALWPENPRLVVFHDEIKESALCWFESEAEQATARSDYPGAITLLDEAASLYSSCGEVYARARQVSDRWADLLLDQCDTLQKESDWSALWQHAILAMTLSAARRDKALDYCGLAEKEILDDLRCRLIVRPISSSSSDLTLVAPVLERVTKALRKAAPAHFEIATEGAVSSNAQSPRDGQVIELRIFLEFDEQEDQQITRYDVSRYLAGRREARNPRFDELLRRKSQLENDKWGGRAAQYGGDALGKGLAQAANAAPLGGALVGLLFSMPGRVAKENANQQLAQVNNELASTSQTQWVEDWREHQYPVYLASRTIQCRTSFAMTELGEQKVFWEDHSLSATSQDRDEYVEPD